MDCQPYGYRLAISTDDSRIYIWNIVDLLYGAIKDLDIFNMLTEHIKAEGRSVPIKSNNGLLCKLEEHTGAVNIVRWSTCGTLLASGGADNKVIIWQPMIINQEQEEKWSIARSHTLHSSDVLDVEWSPDLIHIASCSMDNKIFVYNILTQGCYGIICKNVVKGLAWDPLGNLLAGATETPSSIEIWKMNKSKDKVTIKDIETLSKIEKLYEEYRLPSAFKRFKYYR